MTDSACGWDAAHWIHPHHRQRMPVAQWKRILLAKRDSMIYRGRIVQMKADSVGFNIVEVYKDPAKIASLSSEPKQ